MNLGPSPPATPFSPPSGPAQRLAQGPPSKSKFLAATLFKSFLALFSQIPSSLQAREWISKDGRQIEADLVEASEAEVKIRLKNGKIYTVPLADLAEASREFALESFKDKDGGKDGTGGKTGGDKAFFDNFDAEWPKSVSALGSDDVTVFKEDADNNSFIYHSAHYKFVCDSRLNTSVVRKFARMFEASYEYCKALPISTQKAHLAASKRHRIELFKSKEEYFKNGGPPGSAGVFIGGRDVVMVPLTSLGVIPSGSSFRVDYDKSNSTLSHEITHQLTDRCYGSPGSRGWFTEGLAEYVANTPYSSAGTFKIRSNRDSIVEFATAFGKDGSGGRNIGKTISMMSLRRWMMQPYNMFVANAQINYGMGSLVTYYFFHMDGDGDRKAINSFLKALRAGKEGEEALESLCMGRDWDELAADITKGWRSRGLKITWKKDDGKPLTFGPSLP